MFIELNNNNKKAVGNLCLPLLIVAMPSLKSAFGDFTVDSASLFLEYL